ncbi:MAG TPA: hypothetical protein VGL56_00740 [Fimbriimonadaceae bacterium]|jgi:hypothetical protein
MVRYICLALFVIPVLSGCSQGPSYTLPAHPVTAGGQMREKLNAMSVPDRIAYIKKHHEVMATMAGASPTPDSESQPRKGKKAAAQAPIVPSASEKQANP